jgi:hypothetical protein
MNAIECTVCVSKYTKRDRKEIKCPYCEYGACRECCETYILSQQKPACMNCKKEWSKRFLRDAYTAAFLTSKYKDHVKNTIFEREKSFMPATQPYIEQEQERERKMEEIHLLHAEISALRIKINDKYRGLNDTHAKPAARKYVRPCGFMCPKKGVECRGFMDETHECGICGQKSCPKCDVFLSSHKDQDKDKDQDHVCNEDDLQTAKLLRKETRPCPKCSVAIFKISGCDQMWCVQCHTGFSWNTGEIEDRIHNPHYYEWMAAQTNQSQNDFLRQQREIYEGICDNRLTHHMAHRIVSLSTDYYYMNPQLDGENSWGEAVAQIIMNAVHMRHVDLIRYRVPAREEVEADNRPERILYMTGKMSEQTFKELMDKKDRRFEKYREYTQIIEMYLTVVLDITRRMLDVAGMKAGEIEQFLQEFNTIRLHANKCLSDVSKAYFSVEKIILSDGRFV